jgi:hypothetical protein
MRHRSERSPRRRRAAAAAVAAAAALCAAPGAASAGEAGSIVKRAGVVEATLAWDAGEFGVANPRLRIVRAGAVAFDGPITDVCAEGCILVADDRKSAAGSMLNVADLDRDGEPEVVVDTYSGGAHCCTSAHVHDFRAATGTYARLTVEWGNSGYRLRDLGGDGRFEMIGTDDAFAYAFTAYAGSARPPKVVRYAHGPDGLPVLKEVTRRFPKLVRSDARSLLRAIRRARRGDDMRGVVAAYVADQYLLRRGRVGIRELDRARRRGLLSGIGGPEGRAYRAALLRFLRTHGYR